MRVVLVWSIVLGIVWSVAGHQPVAAQSDAACFAETGLCIDGPIRTFWEQHGGLPVFGYPITPQREERIDGQALQVQWFERNRLELHPENEPPYDVQLGRLGADRLAAQGRDWLAFPKDSQAADGCQFFAETEFAVCGDVLTQWQTHGLDITGDGTSASRRAWPCLACLSVRCKRRPSTVRRCRSNGLNGPVLNSTQNSNHHFRCCWVC